MRSAIWELAQLHLISVNTGTWAGKVRRHLAPSSCTGERLSIVQCPSMDLQKWPFSTVFSTCTYFFRLALWKMEHRNERVLTLSPGFTGFLEWWGLKAIGSVENHCPCRWNILNYFKSYKIHYNICNNMVHFKRNWIAGQVFKSDCITFSPTMGPGNGLQNWWIVYPRTEK